MSKYYQCNGCEQKYRSLPTSKRPQYQFATRKMVRKHLMKDDGVRPSQHDDKGVKMGKHYNPLSELYTAIEVK